MKILVAPDSFKGSLSSEEICLHIEKGINKANPSIEVISFPMADGGEGTIASLIKATKGKIIPTVSHDPLMRKIQSYIGVLGDNKTAVIEMSITSGITLLRSEELNPLITTTFGTGELIKAALDLGYRNILVGVGGSATNDGGMGMAAALGVKFLDRDNLPLPHGGGTLNRLAKIDLSGIDSRILDCNITAICDVNNPLCGPYGASYIFSPQKGAKAEDVKLLDDNLKHYARIIEKYKGLSIMDVPGAGAAGGLAGGIIAFLNGSLKGGTEALIELSGLRAVIPTVDYIITGEGRLDKQTSFGKVPLGIASLGQSYGVPVIAFAGTIGEGATELYNSGLTGFFSIADGPLSLKDSINKCGPLLENLAENVARLLSLKS